MIKFDLWKNRQDMTEYLEWFLDFCRSVTAKRPRIVLDHILGHRYITPDLLADLRRVIELPLGLGEFDEAARHKIHRFLRWAKGMGADKSCVARHQRA